jgi:hypothetical protein
VRGPGVELDLTMSELAVSPSACVPPEMTLIDHISRSIQYGSEDQTKLESKLAELFGGLAECPGRGKMDDMVQSPRR